MTFDMTGAMKLYLVADPDHSSLDVISSTREALAAGVTCVQLRWKTGTDRDLCELAGRLVLLTREFRVPLVINDRVDIALVAGADGVHLGIDDVPITAARRLGGPGFLIGYSPDTDEQIAQATIDGADYLGIGPLYSTSTKADAGLALGESEFARRRSLTSLPVVAIGGISTANASRAIHAGASGVAVVSAILASQSPGDATRLLIAAIESDS